MYSHCIHLEKIAAHFSPLCQQLRYGPGGPLNVLMKIVMDCPWSQEGVGPRSVLRLENLNQQRDIYTLKSKAIKIIGRGIFFGNYFFFLLLLPLLLFLLLLKIKSQNISAPILVPWNC